jgi:hypothetical protein
MNEIKATHEETDMLDEYDFSGGIRGKYTERFAGGAEVVTLDFDVASPSKDTETGGPKGRDI